MNDTEKHLLTGSLTDIIVYKILAIIVLLLFWIGFFFFIFIVIYKPNDNTPTSLAFFMCFGIVLFFGTKYIVEVNKSLKQIEYNDTKLFIRSWKKIMK